MSVGATDNQRRIPPPLVTQLRQKRREFRACHQLATLIQRKNHRTIRNRIKRPPAFLRRPASFSVINFMDPRRAKAKLPARGVKPRKIVGDKLRLGAGL